MTAGHDITRSMVALWHLEDAASATVVDAIGANTLTNTNGVTAIAGKVGTGAHFARASSQYYSIADNAALSMGATSMTLATWLKLDSKPTISWPVSKWDFQNTQREYGLRYLQSDDRLDFRVTPDGINVTSVPANTLGSPPTGSFMLAICWYDIAAGTINIQVNNGTVDSTSYTGGAVFNGTSELRLGALQFSADPQALDGVMDEPAIWKRVLDADERAYLWNGGSGRSLQIVPIKGQYQTALTVGQSYQTELRE